MRLSRQSSRAAGAVVGIGAVLGGGTIVASATASSVAPCHAVQLSATMTHIPGSEGAGSTGYLLNVRNNGYAACRLGNHPALVLLGARGAKLPTHVSRLGKPVTVTIAPRHTASARLRFSPDIPGPGEPGKGACEPPAHGVRVSVTAPGTGTTVGPVKPPTSVCEHGGIQEQPLR
jgi:hypothetical protein